MDANTPLACKDDANLNCPGTRPADDSLNDFQRVFESRRRPAGGWFLAAVALSRALVASTILVTLAVFLFLELNRSGKQSWLKHKRELEARGEVIDWNAYIPAAMPDDQNIFGDPKIADWFVKGGSAQLSRRLGSGFSGGQGALARPIEIARLTILTNNSESHPMGADLVLSYDAPNLSAIRPEDLTRVIAVKPEVIPLIVLEDVPLTLAISNLAKTARLNCTIDPDVFPHRKGERPRQPYVSLRWKDVTAIHALKSLLKNYGLALLTVPETRTARIVVGDPFKIRVFTEPATREKINTLAQQTLSPITEARNGVTLNGSQGFTFVKTPLNPFKPIQILVRADEVPDSTEIAAFFPADIMSPRNSTAGAFKINRTGTNTFSAVISPTYYDAEDYLAWSDQFEPEFDVIRQALKRPGARMDGDYRIPFKIPIPNFVALRAVAQTLAQRAQCCLLLGQSEEAVQELALLHDLSRLLEPRPSPAPVTLVAAMINVAVTGLYIDVISDGFRLHAWREPQLEALQKQLKEVDLPPIVVQALRTDRAAACRTIETVSPAKLGLLSTGTSTASPWQKLRDPNWWISNNLPRGWIYQNMVTVSGMDQKLIDSFDPEHQIIRPHDVDQTGRELEKACSHFSPATFMAAIIIPNYSRVSRTTAFRQTAVNQALVACALERYRLAQGSYPGQLSALVPGFADALPHDIISGQSLRYLLRTNDQFVLYSVGWNEVDDGGAPASTKNGTIDSDQGDWVWLPDKPGT